MSEQSILSKIDVAGKRPVPTRVAFEIGAGFVLGKYLGPALRERGYNIPASFEGIIGSVAMLTIGESLYWVFTRDTATAKAGQGVKVTGNSADQIAAGLNRLCELQELATDQLQAVVEGNDNLLKLAKAAT